MIVTELQALQALQVVQKLVAGDSNVYGAGVVREDAGYAVVVKVKDPAQFDWIASVDRVAVRFTGGPA